MDNKPGHVALVLAVLPIAGVFSTFLCSALGFG